MKLVLEYVDIALIPPPPFIPGIFFYLMKGKYERKTDKKKTKLNPRSIECIQDKKYARIYLKNEKYSLHEKTENRSKLLSESNDFFLIYFCENF